MERIYYKSKWRYEDLQDKKVQFTLTTQKLSVKGFGVFQVHVRGELVSIDIVVRDQKNEAEHIHHQLYETSLADKIERHPDQSVADFRLLG
ncbi:MAG: hypothetical protein WCO56_10205 [Verrucomicrobiota bacterium]